MDVDEMNIEKICRACLKESEKMVNVFKVNVSKKLMACADVQVWKGDKLPSLICNGCAGQLHVAYELKKRVEKNDRKLRAYIDSMKKQKAKNRQAATAEIHKNRDENSVNAGVDINQQMSDSMSCVFVDTGLGTMNHFLNQNHLGYIQTVPDVQVISDNYQPSLQTISYQPEYNNTIDPMEAQDNLADIDEGNSDIDTEPLENIENKDEKEAQEEKRIYKCSTCKKSFKNKYYLNRHMKLHSPDKRYECKICKKCFAHGGNFKIHLRIHAGLRPFDCNICGRPFTLQADVRKHMRVHTGERPYKCPMCDKAFSTSSNLAAHKRTHTGERPYVCSWCNKGFCQSNELTKHIRVHTGEKSHFCDICHRGFNGSGPMLIHRKTHRGDRMYQCTICEQRYKTPNVLQKHMKTHKKCIACKKEFSNITEIKEHHARFHRLEKEKRRITLVKQTV